jgi:hypothetical protein
MVPGLVHRRPCHIDLSLFSITGVVRSRVFKPAVWTAGTAASLAGASYQPVEKRGGSDFIPARGCVMEYLRLGDGTIEQS